MNNKVEKDYFPVKPFKSFLVSLLNGALILTTSLGLFLGVYSPIKNQVLKQEISDNESSYETVLFVGRSSHLMMTDENNTTEYPFSHYYEKFVAGFIKTDYLNPIYDMESDPDGYKNAEDNLESFNTISIDNDVFKDGFIGEFYTSFTISRTNSSGDPLWTPSSQNKVTSFYNDILQINDLTKGGQFFTSPDENNLIHLKADVRKTLLYYTVQSLATLNGAKVDKLFYDYFKEIFVSASNLLLTDLVYSAAYSTFNETNNFLIKVDAIVGVSIILIMIAFFIFVSSLFNKEGKTISNLLTKTQYITDDEEFPIKNKLLLLGSSIIKYFHVFLIVFMLGNPDVLTVSMIQIKSLKITPAIFGVISLIYCVASIIVSMVDSENRNLDAIISQTYLVTSTNCLSARSTCSDTDLV